MHARTKRAHTALSHSALGPRSARASKTHSTSGLNKDPQLFLHPSPHPPPPCDPAPWQHSPSRVSTAATCIPGRDSHCPRCLRELGDTYLAVHFLQLLLADRCFAILHGPQKELHVRQQRVSPSEVPPKTLLHIKVPMANLEAEGRLS